MARRKRGKLSQRALSPEQSKPETVMPETTTYPPARRNGSMMTLKEMPVDQLAELAQSHERVVLSIKRRNNRGQLASLGWSGVVMPPKEVLDIASFIEPKAGGGVYVIDVIDPKDTVTRLTPPFEVVVEGDPRPPMSLSTPRGAMGHPSMPMQSPYGLSQPMPGAMSAQDIPIVPGVPELPRLHMNWSQGLDPQSQAAYLAQVQAAQRAHSPVQLPPGASLASDQLAVDQLRRAEADRASLQAQLNAIQQRHEERERQLQEELRKAEEKARDEAHRAQLAIMQKQIELLSAPKEPPKAAIAEYTPLIAALAPVFATMITASKEQQQAMLAAQQQSTQQIMALVVDQAKRPQPDPFAAIEKLAPLIALNKPDTAANAALFETMGNLQLQNMGMMAQMVESLGSQGDNSSPWVEVLKQLAGNAVQVAQAWQADQQRQAIERQQQARALPPQVVQSRPIAATAPMQPVTQSQHAAPPVAYHTIPAQPAQPTQAMPMKLTPAMLDMLPQEFRTPEWKGIIMGLHEMKPAEEIGATLARYIGHLNEFDMLPVVLADYHVNPPDVLRRLVQPLPVYTTHRDYIEQVIEATVQAMFAEGVLVHGDEDPEDPDDAAGEQDEGIDVEGVVEAAAGEDADEEDADVNGFSEPYPDGLKDAVPSGV